MSQFITLRIGAAMTTSYRVNKEKILTEEYQDQDLLPICETFDRSTIEDILSQEGCAKVRIYYGMDDDYKVHAIMVGVSEDGQDMLPSGDDDANSQIAENAQRCPTICPPSSPLNS